MNLWLRLFSAAALGSALSGCATYELQGVVVEGATPGVFVVSSDDAKLKEMGLVNAAVDVTLDPLSLGGRRLGVVHTDERGRFSVPIGDVGAGWMEYDVAVFSRMAGFAPTYDTLRLPSFGRRLVVVMAPGADRDPRPEDIRDEARRAEELMRQP
jgi:hypothetical protein